MSDKLMYILNDDTQNCSFCRLQLLVDTFGHSTIDSKFNKSPQSCPQQIWNVIIKLNGLV